jgi:hypothetical protein
MIEGAIFEYTSNTIIRRSLTGEAPRVIPTGFIYGSQIAVGGGYAWWIKGVHPDPGDERAMTLELWAASDRGGTPAVVAGELAIAVDLYSAPDGVFIATRDALVHVDHAGNRRVELARRVDVLAVTGDWLYLASEASILRRKLAGGELELVASLPTSGQVRALAAAGDRAVWFDTSNAVETNRRGSATRVVLATLTTDMRLAASPSELYVAVGNVVYSVGERELRPFAKARSDITALGAGDRGVYALVEQSGLTRLCAHPNVRVRKPSSDLDCPPNHTAIWFYNVRHSCIDPQGDLTGFHRDFYFSGDPREERTPDGRFARWWADGKPIVEGHFDEQGLEDGEWLEYTDNGLEVTHYDKGHKLP